MINKIFSVFFGAILVFGLAGCGSSQSKPETQSSNPSKSSNGQSMQGMNMPSEQPLTKAFQDELKGFTDIEQGVKKEDYTNASTVADNLHSEFHAAILPPLKEKKGATYAEDIHGKYDELQDAIKSKNDSKITDLLKVNRDNLKITAKILGVSLK